MTMAVSGAGGMDTPNQLLDARLRDWVVHASGFFIDPTVTIIAGLDGAPIGDATRRVALPDAAWLMLEKGGEPFVLIGIQQRMLDVREYFAIFEYCVTGASRISFWERAGAAEWNFLRADPASE